MLSGLKAYMAAGLLLGLAGCYSDKPHDYGQARPPVDQLNSDDRGLQSKDVVAASDKMAMDILSSIPELNSSPYRWTVVVDRVENLTTDRRGNYDMFIERTKVKLAQLGHNRVALIENRDKFRELQAKELEQPAGDQFGQGGGGRPAPGPMGTQPDFALYAKIMEQQNRATSYFLCEFTLLNLRTREQVWINMYEVKVFN